MGRPPKPGSKLRSVHVHLSPAEDDAVRALARRDGQPVSVTLRSLVRLGLANPTHAKEN